MSRRTPIPVRLAFGFLLALFALAAPALAQARSVTVLHRDDDATIRTNGDVVIVGTWQVQFTGGPYHTAFRPIPLNRVKDITDRGVSEGERPYRQSGSQAPSTFEVRDDGGSRTVR